MDEKRTAKRLVQENEITISIVSRGKTSTNEKYIYHTSTDISASGARIQANTFLPVDTLLKIQLTLKNPPQNIIALGKVKWIRSLYADESYEAGLEFIDTSEDTIAKLADYVSRTQKGVK